MPTPIRTTFLHPGALPVGFAALHAGGGEPAGLLRGRAVPLLHRQDVLEELTARQAFVVLLGEQRLKTEEEKFSFLRILFFFTQPPHPTWGS